MPENPPPERYTGALTNTDRWRDVALRSGDILVCTPPKCGTTWTQSIIAMLVAGTTEVNASQETFWLDSEITPLADMTAAFDAKPGRRFAKTHTPLDGVPFRPDLTYIAVYRHPLDALLSVRKHIRNLTVAGADHPYLRELPEVVDHFITAPLDRADIDEMTLASVVHHFRCTDAVADCPNVLVLHYAGMRADPARAIKRIADHIGLPADPGTVDRIAEATSFANMKARADRFAPHAADGILHDSAVFFDSGRNDKFVGRISAEQVAAFKVNLDDRLPAAQANWLLTGAGPAE